MKQKLFEQDIFNASREYENRAFETEQERSRQKAQKAREAKAAQEASAEAEGNKKLQDLRFKEQNARNAVAKLTDFGREMAFIKQLARGDFNNHFGLPPAEKSRIAPATRTVSRPTEPAVPTAEPVEPAVPTAEPPAPEPISRNKTRQVVGNNQGRRLYENNRSKIIFETVMKYLGR